MMKRKLVEEGSKWVYLGYNILQSAPNSFVVWNDDNGLSNCFNSFGKALDWVEQQYGADNSLT